jgi:hypothetical protein
VFAVVDYGGTPYVLKMRQNRQLQYLGNILYYT